MLTSARQSRIIAAFYDGLTQEEAEAVLNEEELAFYEGCVNSVAELKAKGIDFVMLEPVFDIDISDDSYDDFYSVKDAGKWISKEELGIEE